MRKKAGANDVPASHFLMRSFLSHQYVNVCNRTFIKDRETALENPRIATMEEVNAFWTKVMNDEHEKTQDRLKASELRAKAAGGFLERVELSGADPVKIVVDIPRAEAE